MFHFNIFQYYHFRIDDEENTEFQNITEVTQWRCGVQSADMRSNIPG